MMNKSFPLTLKKLLSFKGRATRKEFYLTYLAILGFNFVLGMLFIFFPFMLHSIFGEDSTVWPSFSFLMPMIGMGGFLSYLVYISVTARRFHDVGLSGWWTLLAMVLPLHFFVFAFMDSQEGENKYGENPKANLSI